MIRRITSQLRGQAVHQVSRQEFAYDRIPVNAFVSHSPEGISMQTESKPPSQTTQIWQAVEWTIYQMASTAASDNKCYSKRARLTNAPLK